MDLGNSNIFSNKIHQQYSKIIIENIPEVDLKNHENFYSLVEYYITSPHKYFNQEISNIFFEFLNNHMLSGTYSDLIVDSISINTHYLDQAIKGLDELNNKKIHENIISNEEAESMYEIGNNYLYEYLKINDLILLGLLKPIAHFLRVKEKKGVEKLDIYNCIETIQSQNYFKEITKKYNHVIRNAIAHGNVQFNGNSIVFKDKIKEDVRTPREFIRNFDDLIDCVNGIVYAYKKFYLIYIYLFEKFNISIPNSIKISELKTNADHYAWKILYSYDSFIQKGKQCNLYVSTTLNSRDFMNISAFQTAAYLEKLMPNIYDSLFIQIKTKYKMACWQSFDMQKFRNYINNGVEDTVTEGTFFFDERYFGKKRDHIIATLKHVSKDKIDYGQLIQSRHINYHSKSKYNVIEKYCLVLNTKGIKDVKSYIRNNVKMFLNKAVNFKNQKANVFTKEYLLPTKYIRVLIYSKNLRDRTFNNLPFIDDNNLIAVIQFNNTKKIRNILPAFGIKEEYKDYTICWSKNYPTIK